MLSPTDDPGHSQFTQAQAQAQAQGKYVMAHAQGTAGITNALRMGVRTIEHGIYLDDEAIDLFLEKNADLVPTLAAPQGVIRKAATGNSGLSPAVIDKAHRVIGVHRESIARAVSAGAVAPWAPIPVSACTARTCRNSPCWPALA
ncbi:amidohydrolase family protein [Cryobacterium psychrophilum]|uniref:amidohydrolase family protein n=1 Tax=Cryobacterium psychrophilum TaxID=41988 RepID=UPI001FBAC608|nr:amidohydrolase family protein [Cryobacterium psychrophilum]